MAAGCTASGSTPRATGSGSQGSGPAAPPGSGSPFSPTPAPAPLVLDVVAPRPDPASPSPEDAYVEGMQLAVDVANRLGGVDGRRLSLAIHDDGGDPALATQAIDALLGGHPLAILYVGGEDALASLHDRFDQTQVPVFLLEGDLYTGRELFPEVFQAGIPWEWQATVLGRYLVRDRKAGRIAFAGTGANSSAAAEVIRAALAYWGGELAESVTVPANPDQGALDRLVSQVSGTDAVVVYGSPADSAALAEAIAKGSSRPPRIVGGAGLLFSDPGALPAGTTACYAYTWAGWAEPIGRVDDFVQAFSAFAGHLPAGVAQEGYDAVRVLRWALTKTGGKGGSALLGELGQVNQTYSSFPIAFGPDDHVALPRDNLGLFAVTGRHEKLDPWQAHGEPAWRAVMRTFTSDGVRDDILDRDRPVFFPFWRKNQPGPEYWRSRYGIVSHPNDPVH
jgi:branched-chain amino acid transport system substrate-binding protein